MTTKKEEGIFQVGKKNCPRHEKKANPWERLKGHLSSCARLSFQKASSRDGARWRVSS